MSRHERRASAAAFKRDVSRAHLDTWLVEADAALTTPLLRDAREWWLANIPVRKPVCVGCGSGFADDSAEVAALLFAAPPNATSAGVSAFCTACWRDLSPDAIDAIATRVLQRVAPGASFHADDPPWPRVDAASEDIA